jgi:hypothetical protein
MDGGSLKEKNFVAMATDLNLPVSGLYLLAARSTPDEVREQAVERRNVDDSTPCFEAR